MELLRRTALVDQAIEELNQQVQAGRWQVGAKLPNEQQLAVQLGVGRSTVREAVRALASDGLVEVRQGAGTFVRARTARPTDLSTRLRRAEVLEVYEVRHGLELQAARLAAVRRTDLDLAAMNAALIRRRRARSAGRTGAFVDADLDFHRCVIAAAHNPVLVDLFDVFLEVLRAALHDLSQDPDLSADTQAQHAALAEAIRRSDADAAAAAALAHLRGTEATLQRLLADQP